MFSLDLVCQWYATTTTARSPRAALVRMRQQQHQLIQRPQPPHIIKYADPHGQHPSQRLDSHAHSRSSSTSSLDVDEMLLRATTGDEHAGGGGTPNGSGATT